MTAVFLCWVAFPLVLAALCIGCGLLVERAAGPLPGALLAPVGLAALIVVASLATTNGVNATAGVWLVVACAVAGFAAGRWRRRADWWAVGAAVAVFAVFAALVVLSGQATFAGYITL